MDYITLLRGINVRNFTKFGGSSVADVIQLNKMKNIIMSDESRRYVVVSAPGKRYAGDNKITDLLYLCKTHLEHNLPYEQIFQVVCDRYMAEAVNLGVKADLAAEFADIRKKLENGGTADYIASRGEYVNAMIIAEFLGFDFVDAADMIVFDKNGVLMPEETSKRIVEILAEHEKAVIPGFYGADSDGNIITFSRGGSDITGSLVAKAVKADVYENWTDVSGLLIADPRIIPDAKPIKTISYLELRELSYMGAEVLHEDSIFPVRELNIPINIRNTNEPDDEGTMIMDWEGEPERIITGIAGNKDFTVIAIYKNMLSSEKGFMRRLFGIFDDSNIAIEHTPSGIDTVSVVVSNSDLAGKLGKLVADIERTIRPDKIDVFEDMALIATVGRGMNRRLGVSAKIFSALAAAEVNVRMIDQGSTEMNIIVGVENPDFEKAIKAIYNAFEG